MLLKKRRTVQPTGHILVCLRGSGPEDLWQQRAMSLRGPIRGERADLLRPRCVLVCLCRSVQELAAALAKLAYLAAKMDVSFCTFANWYLSLFCMAFFCIEGLAL